MGRNYSLPTIKTLFAQATHCAYPGCSEPLIFEDRQRGVRAVGVQIAHIRSETPDGPRYDPGFPRSKLNEPENLLLLCGKHHTAVDQHESVFTTEELLEWKAAQVAQGPGPVVTDADLAGLIQSLESALSAMWSALQVRVVVKLVGGLSAPVTHGVISIPLEAVGTVRFEDHDPDPTRLVGVEVVNQGWAAVQVQAAGLQFDLQAGETFSQWQIDGPYCRYPQPHRLEGHATASWFVEDAVIRNTVVLTAEKVHRVPRRVRAYTLLGDGSVLHGDWTSIMALPIWKPGMTELELPGGKAAPAEPPNP